MRGESVEDLAGLSEVAFEGVYVWVVEGRQVKVEDLVALREEVRNTVSPGFAGPTGEYDSHCDRCWLFRVE
jgi:hypothetical protein